MPDTKTPPPYSVQGNNSGSAGAEERMDVGIHTYLFVLWKRKLLLAICLFASLSAAIVVNVTQKPVFRASTEVVLQPKESDTTTGGGNAGNIIMQDPTFLLTQIRIINGPQLAEKIVQKFETVKEKAVLAACFALKTSWLKKDSDFTEAQKKSLISAVRGSISVTQVEKGARIFSISMIGYDALGVKELVDTAAESYIDLNYETQIEAFKKSFSVISKSLSEIREKIKTGEIASQKISKELQLLEQFKVYGDKHPMVLSLQSDISALSTKLKESTKDLAKMEISQRKDRFSLLVEPHTDMKSLTESDSDLQIMKPILDQEVDTNKELYNSLFKKLQEVELTGSRNVWLDAKVIERAPIPGRPIRPNKSMNLLMGLVVGLLAGTGLAYFLEYLDSSLRNLNDLRSYLKIFPLGIVPFVEMPEEIKQADMQQKPELSRTWWNTNDGTLPLYVAEAYRIIRTSLAFGSLDRTIKVLQVTSAVKGEGKTTTACNLGISLAQAGLKTLLIDADMRRPSMHHILSIGELKDGLSNILSGSESPSAFVRPTNVPNLFCIAGGVIPPNPAELLSSKRLKVILNELKDQFDMILVDSPPIISVADSPIIATAVEATILVSRAGYIPRHICLHAKNILESVNGKIIGGVLNAAQSRHQSYYYSRYYGYNEYYGYYGQSESDKKKQKRRSSQSATLNAFERFKLIQDSLVAMLSSAWMQLIRFIKWDR